MRRAGFCALLWTGVVVLGIAGPACPASAALFDKTDPQTESELGRRAAREVEETFPLSRDEARNKRLSRVGQSLVACLPRVAYAYEFKALARPEINAFCLPGGFIYVFEGLMDRLPSDDALAFVLAHEITHASRRHWAEHVNRMKGFDLLAGMASVFGSDLGSLAASLAHGLISLRYSRDQEREADQLGLDLAAAAGYNPEGALQAMSLLASLEGGKKTPTYLKNHPSSEERLERLRKHLPDVPKPKIEAAGNTASIAAEAAQKVAGSCGDLTGIEIAPNPWFPLDVHREWRYETQGAGGSTTYTLRVVARVPVGDRDVYRAETVLGSAAVPCQLLTTATTLMRRIRPHLATSAWQIEHAMPESGTIETAACTFTAVGIEAMKIPCGDFPEVLHVRKTIADPPATYDIWFARGVGMIKRVRAETGVTELLVDYKAPAAAAAPPVVKLPQ